MNRRDLLALSGALAAASLAGCADEMAPRADSTPDATDTPTGTEPPAAEPPEDPPQGEPQVDDERLAALAAGNAGFALDLHRQLADTQGGNTFLSPYSISVALAMTYAGARGDTETELRETLRYTLGEAVHDAFAEVDDALDERETTTDPMADEEDAEVDAFRLAVANAVWGQEGYPFSEAYLDLLAEQYDGGFREADFAEDPESERERINEWVADETNGRIEELLPPGSVGPDTVLALTNAIYFMAGWHHQFDPENTTQESVTALDGSTATVPMMAQSLETDYADLPRAQAIELPYTGEDVSMVLMLPDAGEFEAFERDLDASTLFGIFEALGRAEGDLRLPRFEYGFDAKLSKPLAELGMPNAFTPDADFSGMVAGDDGPWIDEVYHQSFVSVDEEGTEAAASTAVLTLESMPPESFDLTFDRPFLFCIRDKPTDTVLFLGRVTDVGAAQG
ncbi:serpin family protein [Haloparvum sp. AD34]